MTKINYINVIFMELYKIKIFAPYYKKIKINKS